MIYSDTLRLASHPSWKRQDSVEISFKEYAMQAELPSMQSLQKIVHDVNFVNMEAYQQFVISNNCYLGSAQDPLDFSANCAILNHELFARPGL